MKAIWNGKVIAESDNTIQIEGNHYFPLHTVKREFLKNSDTHTVCPWKGKASYYDVVVEGVANRDAAWYYPNPSDMAKDIRNYVAFWQGIKIVK